jgi:NAD(P)-dependent dehydrogenase (short-subunit alcohol dehydrogenase family)
MDLQLTGRRAIVTGGSRGIGLEVARSLAAEGVDVALAARDAEAMGRAAEVLRNESGRRVITAPVDTTDDASVDAMVEHVVSTLGGVDILINAAAKPDAVATNLQTLTNDIFRLAMETKVLGYLRCIRAVVPHMEASGWGRIVNVSGLAARSSGSLNGAMRNVAVAAMTKSLADELGRKGINVTVVHPGVTRTDALDEMLEGRAAREGVDIDTLRAQLGAAVSIGRIVDAREVAAVVTFLASPLSVSITGDAIATGGGQLGAIHY